MPSILNQIEIFERKYIITFQPLLGTSISNFMSWQSNLQKDKLKFIEPKAYNLIIGPLVAKQKIQLQTK